MPMSFSRSTTRTFEAASISPPNLEIGAEVTLFSLSPTSDDVPCEVSIHTNLINAVSECVKKIDRKEHKTRINLSGIRVEIFHVLVKWLYSGQIPTRQPPSFAADEFWASVFLMSRKLKVSALQVMSFEKFERHFQPGLGSSNEPFERVTPSPTPLELLFNSDNAHPLLQHWVRDHLLWMFYDDSSVTYLESIAKLIQPYPALAAALCLHLFATKKEVDVKILTTPVRHPSKNDAWYSYRSTNLDDSQADGDVHPEQDQEFLRSPRLRERSVPKASQTQKHGDTTEEMDIESDGELKAESVEEFRPRAASFVSDETKPESTDYLKEWYGDPPSKESKSHRRKSKRQQQNGSRPIYDLKEMFSQAFDG